MRAPTFTVTTWSGTPLCVIGHEVLGQHVGLPVTLTRYSQLAFRHQVLHGVGDLHEVMGMVGVDGGAVRANQQATGGGGCVVGFP